MAEPSAEVFLRWNIHQGATAMPMATIPKKDACDARAVSPATGAALSRRQLTRLAAALAMGAVGQTVPVRANSATPASPDRTPPGGDAVQTLLAQTAPQSGLRSRIALGDRLPRLVPAVMLETDRLAEAYTTRDRRDQAPSDFLMPALPPIAVATGDPGPERWRALQWPSSRPILLNRDKAALYLLALCPPGLAKPEIATSYPYSALTPWRINVASRLAKVSDLLPRSVAPRNAAYDPVLEEIAA